LDLFFQVKMGLGEADGGDGVFKVADKVGAGASPSIADETDDFFKVGEVAGVLDILFESEVVDLPSIQVEKGVVDEDGVVGLGVNSREDTGSEVEGSGEGSGRHLRQEEGVDLVWLEGFVVRRVEWVC
jgi:hypothetical protein